MPAAGYFGFAVIINVARKVFVFVLRIVNKLTFGFCAAHINIRKPCGKPFVSPYEVIIRYLELFAYYNYF